MPEKKLTRLYQGRVARAEAVAPAAASQRRKSPHQPPPPAPAPPVALAELEAHHRLFQDAVNYYLVALAALAAPGGDAPMSRLRVRLGECWSPFTRGAKRFAGLRASLAPYLPAGSCDGDIGPAFRAILAGNPVSPAVLSAAVDSLAGEIKGERAVQQRGRDRWPMFCNPDFDGTFPKDGSAVARAAAKGWLPGFLHDPAITPATAAARLELRLFANIAVGKPPYEGQLAQERLREAADSLLTNAAPADAAGLNRVKQAVAGSGAKFAAYRAGGAGARIRLARLNAFLLLKYVEASDFTLRLLRDQYPAPKPGAKPGTALQAGDDPIRLARGTRGFVFPAFTSLPAWGGDGREPRWKEFDIAAFKEALKVINQYHQRTEARDDARRRIGAQVAWIEGVPGAELPKRAGEEEGEDEGALPVLGGDPRWDLLRQLLQGLADAHGIEEDYGLSRRSLRGFGDLREKWRRVVKAATKPTPAMAEKLLAVTAEFQAENGDRIGNINLFRELAKPEYWALWREPDGEAQERENHGFATDVLQAACRYFQLKEDGERKSKPVSFTPADAIASPRQFLFSDLAGKSAPVHWPACGEGTFVVEVSLARIAAGTWREERVRLFYSAPRLRRDHLRRPGEASLDAANWLQPMVAALGLPEPAAQDLTSAPVGLMPKAGRDGQTRWLLNFALGLDPGPLQTQLGKQRWAEQLAVFGKGDEYLRWPRPAARQPAAPWWERGEPFTCLAVDLGQRDAGAFAVLRACREPAAGGSPGRRIGNDGQHNWSASLSATGLLRLPGEDARVWRGGAWAQEYSGEKGRLAKPEETAEAASICRQIGQDPDECLGAEAAGSFPRQNDQLLRAASRALGQLRQCHRWLWMLGEQARRQRALEEIGEIQPQGAREDWGGLARGGGAAELPTRIGREIERLNEALPRALEAIADRCLPWRGKRWAWGPHSDPAAAQNGWHELVPAPAPGRRPLLAGQRGLAMERIGQIENLRRCLQSLNRLLRRPPDSRPASGKEMREEAVPDPCPAILERLDRLKRQRVNQTAHMILAQALGVRLRPHAMSKEERQARDQHGEYEVILGRAPVDFIVLENLSRYLSSQDRPPRENSRLMLWCHRQILAKVKEMAEPFGICVLETGAAYSSRFCSRTGAAGFRAVELTPEARDRWPWKKILSDPKHQQHGEVMKFFAWLDAANRGRREAGKPPRCLLAPERGGPLFISLLEGRAMQADINAAINLGLRAIAAPEAADIHVRLRTEVTGAQVSALAKNKREQARWNRKPRTIHAEKPQEIAALLRDSRQPNFFADVAHVAAFDRASIPGLDLTLASGKGLWTAVKQKQWAACQAINRRRLEKWGVAAPSPAAAAAGRE